MLRCATGKRRDCRAAVQASLREAVEVLTEEFGSADPADWTADAAPDRIDFVPGGPGPLPWQNRPTWQQVVQIVD